MRPTSAVDTVIATPELASILFALLPSEDLVRCIRVCKAWSRRLEPLLWADFATNLKGCYEGSTGLIRNLPFIRTMELNDRHFIPIATLVYGLPLGPKRLKTEDGYYHTLKYFVTLLHHNLFLTHLTLPLYNLGVDGVPLAISRLKHLQHLTVVRWKEWEYGNRTTLLLLQACLPLPNLTELSMDLDVLWEEEEETLDHTKDAVKLDLEAIIKESAIARFSQNPSARKIKLLHFPLCIGVEMNPLLVPLLTSGLLDLETCKIISVTRCRNTWEVERNVLEYCPNLKHLTYERCSEEQDSNEDNNFPRAFIRGCLRLESFASEGNSCLDSHSAQPIISDLVAHHCNTLREIELKDHSRLSGRYQQAILSRCKQLRRFWVEGGSQSSIGLNLTDVSRSDWVCMELRELRLTLDLHFDVGDVSELEEDEILNTYLLGQASLTDTESVERARKRFFTQIGRLSKLEKLTLDIGRNGDIQHWWELTLSQGELGELAGLKNLRSLSLEADFWTKMGQAEVEFMHEHWPLLDEIILVICSEKLSKLRTLSHWQWLFDKRPRLVFKKYGED